MIQIVDEKIVFFFQGIRTDILTAFFRVFIRFEFWDVVAILLVLYFFLRTKIFRFPVVSYWLAWNGANFCYAGLKHYFHRPRPFLTLKGLTPVVTAHGFSFPSGHATMAAAMVIVLGCHFPKSRYLVIALAVLVGISRVYFGVHYLSDVLAGFVLGIIVGFVSLILESLILKVNKPYNKGEV